jgi:hypothetical protein
VVRRGCGSSSELRRRGALPPSLEARTLLAVPAVPAAGRATCEMSVCRGEQSAQPGTRLSWLLCCSVLLSPAAGYVIVSSVSWAVTNEVDEELDSASTEEALPALLEDSGSIWQQSFPASAHKEDPHLRPQAGAARARPPPAPRGMFSYRRESGPATGTPPSPRLWYCALPGPRQRLGLSGHRVRPREGKPPAARGLQVHASGWPGDQAARTGDKAMLATAHVFRSDQLAELDLKRLANNGTRLCLDGLNWQNACAWEWRAGGGR